MRKEQFRCYFIEQNSVISLSSLAREIAQWLANDGELRFDNEPDKYYNAYFTGTAPLNRHLKYGEFDLEFTYSPPFAFTEQQQELKTITSQKSYVLVTSNGTIDTPCRIIIKNIGTTTIKNLRVTRSSK